MSTATPSAGSVGTACRCGTSGASGASIGTAGVAGSSSVTAEGGVATGPVSACGSAACAPAGFLSLGGADVPLALRAAARRSERLMSAVPYRLAAAEPPTPHRCGITCERLGHERPDRTAHRALRLALCDRHALVDRHRHLT